MPNDHDRLVGIASVKIAAILKTLEQDAGRAVQSISIETYELTNCEDDTPRFSASVRIELHRDHNREWI